jgi:hypothetical protein
VIRKVKEVLKKPGDARAVRLWGLNIRELLTYYKAVMVRCLKRSRALGSQ